MTKLFSGRFIPRSETDNTPAKPADDINTVVRFGGSGFVLYAKGLAAGMKQNMGDSYARRFHLNRRLQSRLRSWGVKRFTAAFLGALRRVTGDDVDDAFDLSSEPSEELTIDSTSIVARCWNVMPTP